MSTPLPDPSDLATAREQFIALWGQMGSNWGIPRTMAQVHALLYIDGEPKCTDQIMGALSISRGNVSMTLRSLVEWGIVTRTHVRGDRKEYFQAEQDVWKLFRTILAERKKREIDPLLDALDTCRPKTASERRIDADVSATRDHNERIDDLIGFIMLIDRVSQRFLAPSGEGLELAAKLLDRAS